MGLVCLSYDNPFHCVWLCCKLSFHVIVFPHFTMKTRTVRATRPPADSTVPATLCPQGADPPRPPARVSVPTCRSQLADLAPFPRPSGSASSPAAGAPHRHRNASRKRSLLAPSLALSLETSSPAVGRPTSHCSRGRGHARWGLRKVVQ